MKVYTAEFRWRDAERQLKQKWVDIKANSLKEAKLVAKGLEGREDDMTWFMGIQPKRGA